MVDPSLKEEAAAAGRFTGVSGPEDWRLHVRLACLLNGRAGTAALWHLSVGSWLRARTG